MPAPLKIIKVLIEELQAAGGVRSQLSPSEIEKVEDEGSDDDGDWEDDPDVLDLGLGTTKQGINSRLSFFDEKKIWLTSYHRAHGFCGRIALRYASARRRNSSLPHPFLPRSSYQAELYRILQRSHSRGAGKTPLLWLIIFTFQHLLINDGS